MYVCMYTEGAKYVYTKRCYLLKYVYIFWHPPLYTNKPINLLMFPSTIEFNLLRTSSAI